MALGPDSKLRYADRNKHVYSQEALFDIKNSAHPIGCVPVMRRRNNSSDARFSAFQNYRIFEYADAMAFAEREGVLLIEAGDVHKLAYAEGYVEQTD